ncbi:MULTISPECIES: DUF4190 domain-containing protein [Microbacterium]|uniref:DUF4190 domain-containing protein n=1 Tax=Microbacterium TaxID=33882 RepID=UPI000D659F99|nr:DUF4190 domain-containing protein [Microbacterium sp. KCTC 39802]
MSDSTPQNPSPEPGAHPPVPPAPGASQPTAPGAYPPPAQGAYAPPAYGSAPASGSAYGAAPAYGNQGAYGAAPAYGYGYGYGAPAKTNTLAIVSLVASIASFVILPFIGSIVGVITGHMSLNQLKTSGEQGRGMALAGTIVGWVGLGLAILGIVAAILFFSFFVAAYQSYPYSS